MFNGNAFAGIAHAALAADILDLPMGYVGEELNLMDVITVLKVLLKKE